MVSTRKPPVRKGSFNEDIFRTLIAWRGHMKARYYSRQPFAASGLLDNDTCERLASLGKCPLPPQLRALMEHSWSHYDTLGHELWHFLSTSWPDLRVPTTDAPLHTQLLSSASPIPLATNSTGSTIALSTNTASASAPSAVGPAPTSSYHPIPVVLPFTPEPHRPCNSGIAVPGPQVLSATSGPHIDTPAIVHNPYLRPGHILL